MRNCLISVEDLSFHRHTQRVISDLNFSVEQGECLALVGANGTGKSTTINLIAGLLRPSKGQILIDGLNSVQYPLEVKKRIGLLPDHLPLYPDLTVKEYLEMIGDLKKIPKSEQKDRLTEVIHTFNLEPYFYRLIGTLSKGLKQRVGIAQAILHKPKILLLDEPTQGLDEKHLEIFHNFIENYKQHAAIVLSTHYRFEIESISTRILKFTSEGISAHDFHDCAT